jgi:hypothetical protein
MTKMIDPKKEILIVKHRTLNNPETDFEQEVDKVYSELGESVKGRQIVPCFEGDYMMPSWSEDVVMVHGNFAPSKNKFEQLRQEGFAAYLQEVLESFVKYNGEAVVCLEAKLGTKPDATYKAVRALQKAEIERAYFDSFLGWKLDHVHAANERQRTIYPTSLHLLAKLGGIEFMVSNGQHDVVTVPNLAAIGKSKKPIIYGAVGSKKRVEKIAEDPNALGAYWRGEEASSLKMLINSVGRKKVI